MSQQFFFLLLLFLLGVGPSCSFGSTSSSGVVDDRNNWAVIVDTSRYWYNYRHASNSLSFYRTIKRLGIPDSQVILMLAEDYSCSPRNVLSGRVFNTHNDPRIDLYGSDVEVDFRGEDVTVENVIRLLTGRQQPSTPRSKRLMTDDHSNIFVFMTGHGGNEFLKFQDWEEISSQDIADAFHQMHLQGRFRRLFYLIDSCQSATMQNRFYSPGVLAAGSSRLNENSYSYTEDNEMGVAVIDRFTFFSLQYFEKVGHNAKLTVNDWFDAIKNDPVRSVPELRVDLFDKPLESTYITEFFASTGGVVNLLGEEGGEDVDRIFPLEYGEEIFR